MTSSKATKKALFMSLISLVLCFTMLMGATFAWFTDTVQSTGNRIQAGNLDVDLVMYKEAAGEYVSIAEPETEQGRGDIFSEATGNGINWEPGKTEIVYLGVRNNGSLALKYNIVLQIEDQGLIGSLEYAILDGVQNDEVSVANWEKLKGIDGVQSGDVPKGTVTVSKNGTLDEVIHADDPMNVAEEDREVDYFALAVHMKEDAGNEYQGKGVKIDILVQATQKNAEEDSFGPEYDTEAKNPEVGGAKVPADTTEDTRITVGDVTVTIPAGSEEGNYELVVTEGAVITDGDESTAAYDISLYKDDVAASGVEYPVEIELPTLVNVTSLIHNGTPITNYNYDAQTGILSFVTDSFSPFVVEYAPLGEGIEFDGDKIVAGTFKGVNPSTIDASLAAEGSDYIAVAFEEGGKECYFVSPRATTVIVAADDAATYADKNYTVQSNMSGKLAGVVSSAPANATICLLPGTYNETSVIRVDKSCEIIGLGDAENIKVVKQKSENSHRHLFNCSGPTGDKEHIQVTIRNMYLDAKAGCKPNASSKLYTMDNGAVQAIYLAKVKCYDLIINDGSTPFYINGKHDAKGAFMYVQDTEIIGSMDIEPQGVEDLYKFYYYNVTTKDGPYVEKEHVDASPIVNVKMEPDDWDWLS